MPKKDLYNKRVDNVEPLPQSQALVRTFGVTSSRRTAIAEVVKFLPLNDLGLPRFLYRTDIIPADIHSREQYEREQILSAAMMPVLYEEGFPAFEDGQPIWSQLPFEPPMAHAAFVKYLEVGQNEGVRLVEDVSTELQKAMPELMDYFHLYYWKFRSKAYDLYISTVHEKKRLRRLMRCEDDHYVLADVLLKKCTDYFDCIDWEAIDPAVVARMLPQLVEIQRKAVGAKTGAEQEAPPTQSVEVILRQMTRLEATGSEGGIQQNANLDILLSNPDAAEQAQELIVKLSGPKK